MRAALIFLISLGVFCAARYAFGATFWQAISLEMLCVGVLTLLDPKGPA